MPRSLAHKFSLTFSLFLDIFRLLMGRLQRLFRHLLQLPDYFTNKKLHGLSLPLTGRMLLWIGEYFFLLFDVLGVPEWYEMANCWGKPHSRHLTPEEKQLAKAIFGDNLFLERIQLDERARIGPKQYHFCYVSFCVINSWETISKAVLVHELVHVWQFQQFGSPYILRALLAQRTTMGYDYGGLTTLKCIRMKQEGLRAFNYEQQASIIEDFARLQLTGFARWNTIVGKSQLTTYQYFVDDLQNQN